MSVTIRRASMEDLKPVMEITVDENLYGGIDYLYVEFKRLVNQADHDAFVLLVDNLIVGFLGCQVTMGGKRLLTLAGRVRPDHRNRGYFKLLQNRVCEIMKEERPNLRTKRMTVLRENEHVERLARIQRVLMQDDFYIFKRANYDVSNSKQTFPQNDVDDDNDNNKDVGVESLPRFLSRDAWRRLLSSTACQQRLAPSGTFFFSGRMLDFHPDELDAMTGGHNNAACLVSGRWRDREDGGVGVDGKGSDEDVEEVRRLTFCTSRGMGFNSSVRLITDFYGEFSLHQFRLHLREILRRFDGAFDMLQVLPPPSPDREKMLRIPTEELGFELTDSKSFYGFEIDI